MRRLMIALLRWSRFPLRLCRSLLRWRSVLRGSDALLRGLTKGMPAPIAWHLH